MAAIKTSMEELKSKTQTAAKGMSGTIVEAAQEAVQQLADSSKDSTRTATEEASKQTQTAIDSVASKAQDSIKVLGQRLVQK